MPLLVVGLLLERREHGTQKPGTQTIQFRFGEPLVFEFEFTSWRNSSDSDRCTKYVHC